MKHLLLTSFIFLGLQISVIGQTTSKDFSGQMILTDAMGNAFKPYYHQVQGTPYLFNNWKAVTFKLKTGQSTELANLKFDIYDQEVHFLSPKKEDLLINIDLVKEFILKDTLSIAGTTFLFRMGYPGIEKQTAKTFYAVLCDGKLQLLCFFTKKIEQFKNEYTGEIAKEFVQYDNLYVFFNGEMKGVKRDKKFFVELMQDKSKEIEEYLKQHKTNFKNTAQIANLITYYNSL